MDNEAVGIPAVGSLFPKPPRAQSKTLAWLMPTTILIFRQQIRYLETLINVFGHFRVRWAPGLWVPRAYISIEED